MKNKKKAVKLAPKDYVNTLIWFLGGFWVEIMLDGNFTYNLGADTCKISMLLDLYGQIKSMYSYK